ncbi:unnamed protein product [Closterium sp. Naga37s-1]|nr:unnamed protein product [Closterium sp. Naga37s-1]
MAGSGRPEGYREGRAWKARVLSTTATGGRALVSTNCHALVRWFEGGWIVETGGVLMGVGGGAGECQGMAGKVAAAAASSASLAIVRNASRSHPLAFPNPSLYRLLPPSPPLHPSTSHRSSHTPQTRGGRDDGGARAPLFGLRPLLLVPPSPPLAPLPPLHLSTRLALSHVPLSREDAVREARSYHRPLLSPFLVPLCSPCRPPVCLPPCLPIGSGGGSEGGLEEAVREVRFSLASDPTNGLLGGALTAPCPPFPPLLGCALAGALFGRLRGERGGGWERSKRGIGEKRRWVGKGVRGALLPPVPPAPPTGCWGALWLGFVWAPASRDIAIRAAVMFGLAGAGHRAAVESFKEWRIQQLLAARVAEHTAEPHASHADAAADTGAATTASSPPEATAAHLSQSPAAAAAAGAQAGALQGKEQGVGERGVGERGVGERGEQAGVKAGGRWEWPEWLPVRRLGEEEVKQRQEEFRQRVAAAQRLEMAGSGREGGLGGAGVGEKGA